MANASPLRWGNNATYISPPRVGGNANFSVPVGGNANFSVFRYQHVDIPNTKLWRCGSKPTRGRPNANGFASQWHIGYKVALRIMPKLLNFVLRTRLISLYYLLPQTFLWFRNE